MISVTFETAGLAAAVTKAARVAPSKGMAFDKAAGIMIEGRPDETGHKQVTIKATNLEVDYLEWVQPLKMEADEYFEWRLGSQLLAGFVGGLPIGAGKTVTISQEASPSGVITIKSGRTQAKINPILGRDYKIWKPFDDSDLSEVNGFAARISQAAWATDPQTVPFSGIHIDGEHIYATDRYRMVRVPCKVPIPRPVTVPLDTLTPILKAVEDVRLGVEGRSLLLMPDEYTQMRTVIFDAEYPPIERGMVTDFDREVTIPRVAMREAVSRMNSLVARGERYPLIELTMRPSQIDLKMEVDGIGMMTDEIPVITTNVPIPTVPTVVGDPDEPAVLTFAPPYIVDALDNTKATHLMFGYRTDKPGRAAMLTDGDGYDVWLAPRKVAPSAAVKGDDE